MKITDFGVAVVEDDTHLSKWVVEQRRLDVQAEYCRLFSKFIPADGIVIDIGACIGDHTLSYSEMVGPKGRVHAFEPNPVAFECLAHNMVKRHNVVIYRLGLGAKPGRASILNPPVPPYNHGGTMIGDSPDGEIKITTIDEQFATLPRLDFIKIDAEGCEPDIIAGATATLARLRPVLLVELNRRVLKARGKTTHDIAEPLEKLGYHLQPSEPHHSFEFDEVDALCLPHHPDCDVYDRPPEGISKPCNCRR